MRGEEASHPVWETSRGWYSQNDIPHNSIDCPACLRYEKGWSSPRRLMLHVAEATDCYRGSHANIK